MSQSSRRTAAPVLETYQAKGNRLLVQEVVNNEENLSPGGIVLPATQMRTNLRRCVVISVGPGGLNFQGDRAPIDIKEGEMVLIGPHAGADVEVNGDKFISIIENDVHGTVSV